MKKCIAILSMIVCMGLSSSTLVAKEIYSSSPIERIFINGKKVQLEVIPYATYGVTLVPLRVISEELGAEVIWQNPHIIIKKDDIEIKLTIDEKEAIINSEKNILTQEPFLDYKRYVYENGYLTGKKPSDERNIVMVTLRFIGEAFDAEVKYDAGTGVISIITHE